MSSCTEELLSTPKITTFLPHSPFDHENCERTSNPILQPIYTYLSGSAFLVNFTAVNKLLPSVKPAFKSLDHVSSSWAIYKFT